MLLSPFSSRCSLLFWISSLHLADQLLPLPLLPPPSLLLPHPQDLSGAVVAGIEEVFDALRDKDEAALLQLLVNLVKQQAVQVAEFTAGLKNFTATLEDFTMDIPKAPGVLGRAVGMAAAEGLVPLTVLSELLEGTEGAEGKRKLAAAAFKAVSAAGGEGKLKELAAGVPVADLLKADEFDGDLPSVADWAKKEGLAGALKL